MAYSCWYLPEVERARLLEIFPATYPDVIAHHVTHELGKYEELVAPNRVSADIVGVVDDGLGVQALVVKINDSTERPMGGVYHITWSIDRGAGRKPVDSNKVIADKGWKPVTPVSVHVLAAVFR